MAKPEQPKETGPSAAQLNEVHKGGVYTYSDGKLTLTEKPTDPTKAKREK